MGGWGSGRRRKHTCMVDCLEIDTAWLNKKKLLQRSQGFFSMTWRKWTETDFKDRKEKEYQVQCFLEMNEHPTLTIGYGVERTFDSGKREKHSYSESISMVSTPCNYGGQRWWFIAPCCGQRVRVVYINLKANIDRMKPLCRSCQELHYESQCSSYIERHASYEKYLLCNYGYSWAKFEYDLMRKHYFEVTDEYAYKARRSELERELELMRHFISFERLMLKMHLRDFSSLKSEENRRMYLKHIASEYSQHHALDLVRLFRHSAQLERDTYEMSDKVLDRFYAQAKAATKQDTPAPDDVEQEIREQESKSHMPYDLGDMIERKKQLENQLKRLEMAA